MTVSLAERNEKYAFWWIDQRFPGLQLNKSGSDNLLSNSVDFINRWCETAYARDSSASATKIIAGKGNIAPKLEFSNSSEKPLGNIEATDRNEKSVIIESNSAQNATESNDEKNGRNWYYNRVI